MFRQISVMLSLLMTIVVNGIAQPRVQKLQVSMIPDHADAIYRIGERAKVKLIVTDCGMAHNGATVHYEVSEDLMPPRCSDSLKLNGYDGNIDLGTMKKPGFLRVKAKVYCDGKVYTSMSTVGFEPEKLVPTAVMPDDFMAFWRSGVEAVRKVDLAPMMTIMPERCTDKVNVYHVSYGNVWGTRMYGVLTMPKQPGRYPGILRLPGAGVGEKSGDIAHAAQGAIVLELGIHAIPVNLDNDVYSDLAKGALASYHTYNCDSKESYYYRRVFLGCVKAVDFLLSLPQCNGNIGTLGGSQGGALSIVASALDDRVKATAVYFPALCDHEGYVNKRAGGWPHFFRNEGNRSEDKMLTMRYYDTSNFAKYLKAPVFYAYGYNDLTCAPTTTCATYNVITAPKVLSIGQNTGHWLYPEQTSEMWNWIINQLR